MIIYLSGEELGLMQQTFNGMAQRRLVMERHKAIDFRDGEEVMAQRRSWTDHHVIPHLPVFRSKLDRHALREVGDDVDGEVRLCWWRRILQCRRRGEHVGGGGMRIGRGIGLTV